MKTNTINTPTSIFAALLLLAACDAQSPNSNGGDGGLGSEVSDGAIPDGSGPDESEPDDSDPGDGGTNTFAGEGVGASDKSCDEAPYPSQEWTACEAENFAKTGEGPEDNRALAFQQREMAQRAVHLQDFGRRAADDISWLSPLSGNSVATPYCAQGVSACIGDPFRYPEATGPDGADFYANEAVVTQVVFYDRDCARITGRVWRPRGLSANAKLPTIVVENGSLGAGEQSYWWAAQLLVRSGYAVLTHDPRGQGRSDFVAPGFVAGTNIDPTTFWLGLVDAIDFMRSSPAEPYPWNNTCANTYPTEVTAFNPEHAVLDPTRLGIAGHSFGAAGVTFVQSYGAPGAEAWPALLDDTNPVDVVVAWDGLSNPNAEVNPTSSSATPDELGGNSAPVYNQMNDYPEIVPRVPVLDMRAEYGVAVAPFTAPPDPEAHLGSFFFWQEAGLPIVSLNFQGSTHLDYSQLSGLPATSWCEEVVDGGCVGSFGLSFIEHYTLAWMDRWLKLPGEEGFDTADARLLNDGGENGADKMSFRHLSVRDFPDRDGQQHVCDDIRGGCLP